VRRLGAAVIAVLMVVVALWIRGRIDDDGGNGGGTGDSSALRVRCATELEATCAELSDQGYDTTVEDAGATARALVAAPNAPRDDVGFDAWLVTAPWPDVVDVQRRASSLDPIFRSTTDPVARSPLVLAVRTDRNDVLASTPGCAGTVTWKCLGEVAGEPWDTIGGQTSWARVRPAHGDPTRSATALAVLSQATSDFLGSEGYSRNDLELNAEYADWLTQLEQAVPPSAFASRSPFLELLQQLPTATYDAVGTTEAEAGPALAAAAPDRRRQVTLLYPDPVISADVVLATVTGADAGAVSDLAGSDDLRADLAETGWRVPGRPRAEGVRAAPVLRPDSGLPDADVLVALQDTWGTSR
jgi:hypothetical protein